MRFRARKTIHLGIVRFHFTQSGFSSWSLHFGIATWNSRTRRWSINTPGIGWVELGHGSRRSR